MTSTSPTAKRNLLDQAWFLMMLPPLFWAGNAVIGRAVVGEVPPIALGFWRWVLAGLIVLPFAWPHLRRDWPEMRRSWRMLVVLSLPSIAIFNTFLYIGLQTTTALNSVFIQSTMPVMIVLMTWAMFGERITRLQMLGVAVSLLGAGTLVARGDVNVILGLQLAPGDVWVFLAVIAYAFYTVMLRKRPPMHGLSFIVATFFIGALSLLPFYLWETASGNPLRLTMTSIGAISYIMIFPSIMAYICYNRAVQLAGANVAGLSIHLIPVFGGILAILFLGEQPHWYHAAGVALIATGILLASIKRRG